MDASKLSDMSRCMRFASWRHEQGWTRRQSPELIYGSSWHKALDSLWQSHFAQEPWAAGKVKALAAFAREWRSNGGEAAQAASGTHHGMKLAEAMLETYRAQILPQLAEWELIGVEMPFQVLLREEGTELVTEDDGTYTHNKVEGITYVGWWDKVLCNKATGRIRIRDHKTCGKSAYATTYPNIQDWWLREYDLDWQVDGYSFAGLEVFGEAFECVEIEAALTHPKAGDGVHDVHRVFTMQRTPQQGQAWREDVLGMLALWGTGLRPKTGRKANCFKYNRPCMYAGFCHAGVEPKQPPEGFVVEFWEPEKSKSTQE